MKLVFRYILLILIIGGIGIHTVISCSLKFPEEAESINSFSSSSSSDSSSSSSETSNHSSSSSVNSSDDGSSSSTESSNDSSSSSTSKEQSSSSILENISSSSASIIYSNDLFDSRDSKTYKTVVIGKQTWMAENLNYNVPNAGIGSKCYGEGGAIKIDLPNGDREDYRYSEEEWLAGCTKYGRLYDWETIMDGAASSNQNPSGVKGICPDGWHVPSDNEWVELVDYVGDFICTSPDISTCYDSYKSGTKLKAKSGWSSYDYYGDGSNIEPGNGTDEFGFAALPGGYCYNCSSTSVLFQNDGTAYYRGTGKYDNDNSSYIFDKGEYGYWWTATEYYNQFENDRSSAYRRLMYFGYDSVKKEYQKKKDHLSSLRCVRDE
jgi:uncharacterized protein (TIGR02145 family)